MTVKFPMHIYIYKQVMHIAFEHPLNEPHLHCAHKMINNTSEGEYIPVVQSGFAMLYHLFKIQQVI